MFRKLLAVGLAVMLLGCLVISMAQKRTMHTGLAPAETVVVSDSFTGSDGTLLNQHQSDSGHSIYRAYFTENASESRIFGGRVTQGTRGFRNIYYYSEDLPNDSRTCVDIQVRDATETARGVVFRLREDDERYMSAGYSSGRAIGVTGTVLHGWFVHVNLGYFGGDQPHEYVIAEFPEVLAVGETRTMCIAAQGNVFTLTVNGYPRITVTDDRVPVGEYAGTYSEGPGSATSGTTLDNFSVSTFGVTPSPSPTPSPYPSPSPSPSPSGSPNYRCDYSHLPSWFRCDQVP